MDICITGASKGLGEVLCRAYANAGHRVWGVARNEEGFLPLREELPEDRFFASSVDVAQKESVLRWVRAMEEKNFVPDMVILNASIQLDDLPESGYDHDAGQQTLDVNVSGSLRCVEALLPGMLQRRSGTFIAIASTTMLRPSVRSAAYGASKAGIAMAMRSLRAAYGKRGVSFKTVCLGPILTPMWEGRKNFLVPSASRAASAILSFCTSRRSILYYPFLSTFLLRISLWLPDSFFAAVSARMMK